jgi:hypothetical protein
VAAKAVRSSHSDAVITVEGFADPQGNTTFNQRLGMARATSVRDYLDSTGGLPDGQVRAVSYGEARNRQLRPDAIGEEGRDNRRVSLVVDYAGTSSMGAPAPAPEPAPTEAQSCRFGPATRAPVWFVGRIPRVAAGWSANRAR